MWLFLMFCLSSCSNNTVTVSKIEKQYPDKKYLRHCDAPVFDQKGAVYSDLFPYINSLRQALELCNNDKAALREWAGGSLAQ